MRFHFIYLIILACSSIAPIHAQNANKEKLRTITLRTMAWEKVEQKLYIAQIANRKNTKYLPISTFRMTASHPLKIKAIDKLILYRKTGSSDAPIYLPISQTKISQSCNEWLLIIFPKEKNNRYPLKAVEDDDKSAPYGGYQLWNFSNLALKVGLHQQGFQLKPNSKKDIKPNIDSKEQLRFAVWIEDEEGKKIWLERNSWIHNPEKHLRYFIQVKKDINGRYRAQSRALASYKFEEKKTNQ